MSQQHRNERAANQVRPHVRLDLKKSEQVVFFLSHLHQLPPCGCCVDQLGDEIRDVIDYVRLFGHIGNWTPLEGIVPECPSDSSLKQFARSWHSFSDENFSMAIHVKTCVSCENRLKLHSNDVTIDDYRNMVAYVDRVRLDLRHAKKRRMAVALAVALSCLFLFLIALKFIR